MTNSSKDRFLLQEFANLASKAGAAILDCRGTHGRKKPDGSPVCAGDRRSEAVILAGLKALDSHLPVISEESFEEGCVTACERFVLVDPLDGTREFLSGSDDFTVNIALIENGVPTLACLYAPAQGKLWLANGEARRYRLDPGAIFNIDDSSQAATVRAYPADGAVALTSIHHVQAEDTVLAARLGAVKTQRRGSSLKFALIADGEADVYPRAGRVMAWDIAAGHAVLEAAGGKVVDRDGAPLDYRNLAGGWAQPGFIAVGDTAALSEFSTAR